MSLFKLKIRLQTQDFCSPNEHVEKKRFPELREKNHSRQLIMPLKPLLPFALVDAARLVPATPPVPLSPAKVSHHSLCVLPNICVGAWGWGGWVGVLIPPLLDGPFAAFFPPSLPTSHLRLAWLCWAQVSQSSAEGQTDFSRQESHVPHRGWRATLLIDSSFLHTHTQWFLFIFFSYLIPFHQSLCWQHRAVYGNSTSILSNAS